MGCRHEECEPYGSCQRMTEYERRAEFWFRHRVGLDAGDLVTDPAAYYDGVTETA